jgi:hypothetical protein
MKALVAVVVASVMSELLLLNGFRTAWGAVCVWRMELNCGSATCELVVLWLAACAHACACTQLAFMYVCMCARLVTVLHTDAPLRCSIS